jgi:hypothetical protein
MLGNSCNGWDESQKFSEVFYELSRFILIPPS